MPGFADSILLVIEFFCGAAGAVALGCWVRSYSFGHAVDGLIGGIGGLILVWPASRIPGVGRFIGHVENAADATLQGVGGLTPAILIGTGIAGLLGGFILILLAGFSRVLIRA
jgi:hypothetical protein